MRLTKIQIRNYRGLETLDVDVPPAGVIASGGNARGKTTLINAVRGALEGRDISPDAIRIGADRSELLVNFEDVSVKRVITQKGNPSLVVEKDGMRPSKPVTFLRELLGSAGLDPLDLYLAKPKDRRALILAALPCAITVEQLQKYAPDVPKSFDVSGHALEVIERARKHFYDERTAANKEAAEAAREVDRLAEVAKVAAQAVSPGPIVPEAEAKASLASAERHLLTLENRANEAAESAMRTATQRGKVAELREEAKALESTAGEAIETDEIVENVQSATDAVVDLEKQLEESRAALRKLSDQLATARTANDNRQRALLRVADLRGQADTLAVALEAATITAPSSEELLGAKASLAAANVLVERAHCQAKVLDATRACTEAKVTAKACQSDADELDAVVKRLTNDAPSDLLKSAEGIPGLTLSGDEVLLEGKSLDALSGAEQLKFAIEIARRANQKSKILVVDGLERIDDDQREAFVKYATRDGWQLIGSLVTGGELVVAAIEPNEDTTAAAAE